MTTPTPHASLVEALQAVRKAPNWRWLDDDTQETVRAALAQAEAAQPVLFMSPKQLQSIKNPLDPADESGTYLPIRKTPAGNFTMPLYAAPQSAEAAPTAKAERVRGLVNAGPYPGMSEAFDAHMGAACWTDLAYRQDAATWAVAWKAALSAAEAAPRVTQAHWEGLSAAQQTLDWLTARAEARRAKFAEAAPKQEAVSDERAACIAWLSTNYPHAWPEQHAAHAWDNQHVFALAWQARAALAAQPQQPAPEPVAPGWISVEDRLPEPDSGEVLVWLSGGMYALDEWHTHREDPIGMSTLHTLDMGCMWRTFDFEEVTHWMPLPAAPQTPAGDKLCKP